MKGWIRQRRGTAEDLFVAEEVFRELAPKRDYRALLGLGQSLERQGVLFRESAEAVGRGERLPAGARRGDPAARTETRVRELERRADEAWTESVAWYERTLEQKPGELQAINGLQRVHALAGRPEESLAWAERLLEQSRAEVEFWEAQLERPELSSSEERRLRNLRRGSRELQAATHLQASTLLVGVGREAAALTHLDEAIALDAEDPEVHSRRAQLLHALDRREEAVASLEDYLRLSEEGFDHPDIARAMELLADWKAALPPAEAR